MAGYVKAKTKWIETTGSRTRLNIIGFTLKILAPDNQLSTCDVRRFHAAIYKQRPAEVWLFLSARTFVRGTGRLDMSESRNNTSSSVCNYGELAPLRCLLTGTRSRP